MGGSAAVASDTAAIQAVGAEDLLRADLYDFLSALLARPPHAALIQRAASLEGDETALGQAIGALSRVAKASNAETVKREFNALFIGMGRGELVPYGSYYLTGFLNEKPLARLRDDMASLGIKRADDVKEPEDNIASLCDMMAALIRGRSGVPLTLAEQQKFFEDHIDPWAHHFFKDLEGAETSVFYAPVGKIGQLMVEIEREAFRMEG